MDSLVKKAGESIIEAKDINLKQVIGQTESKALLAAAIGKEIAEETLRNQSVPAGLEKALAAFLANKFLGQERA